MSSEEIGDAQQQAHYKRVCDWSCDEVVTWIKGLGDGLSRHLPQLRAHCIAGPDLLKVSRQQLEYLKVVQVGHQEVLLEAVELLASVDNARTRHSTMSLASTLSKRASQLMSLVKQPSKDRDSQPTVDCVEVSACLLRAARLLINWLDRFPSNLIEDYDTFREELLKATSDITSAMDGDELDLMKTKKSCSTVIKLTEGMMMPEFFNQADPVSLMSISLCPDEDKGLGFVIQRSRHGSLIISRVHPGSPAEQCGRIYEGMEIIQIGDQNVVAWEVKNVVHCLKASGHQVDLILRVSNNKIGESTCSESSSSQETESYPMRVQQSESFSVRSPLLLKHQAVADLKNPLNRASSSPAMVNEGWCKPAPLSPLINSSDTMLRKIPNGIDNHTRPRSVSGENQDQELSRRRRSSSLSGLLTQSTGVLSTSTPPTTPTSTSSPIIAYRTEIVGGVVRRVPIQPHDDSQGSGTPKSKRGGSHRKKPKLKLGSGERDKMGGVGATCAKSPFPSPMAASPLCNNEGGDLEHAKAIFSNPTDVVIEGHATKQVTVSSSEVLTKDELMKASGKKTNRELLVPCFQLKDTDHEGWMTKQGGSGFTPKNWRKRWFVLKDGKLFYYKTSFDISALGIVSVPGYSVEVAPEMKKKNGFKLTKSGNRTYYFHTDTAEEMTRWMSVLSDASSASAGDSDVTPSVSVESTDDKSEDD